MARAPQIRPITDLKKTAEIAALCHESGEPVFITKNGYSDLVIMSVKTYEKRLFPDEAASKPAARRHSIPSIREALANVCGKDARVRRIVLFGSYAKGEEKPQSDIDLYLDSGRQITGLDFFGLRATLEDALEKEVDLLADLDVIPDSPIAQAIEAHGVTVYEK